MTLRRDLSGDDLARLLRRHYGYRFVRQQGSHMTVATEIGGVEYSVTIPRHRQVKVGTLGRIIAEVAEQIGLPRAEVRRALFGR